MKKKKDLLQSERNDLCRKEMNLQQSLSALKEELAKAEQTLRSMAGKPILNGRDSVKKVLQIFREKGKGLILVSKYRNHFLELCKKKRFQAL